MAKCFSLPKHYNFLRRKSSLKNIKLQIQDLDISCEVLRLVLIKPFPYICLNSKNPKSKSHSSCCSCFSPKKTFCRIICQKERRAKNVLKKNSLVENVSQPTLTENKECGTATKIAIKAALPHPFKTCVLHFPSTHVGWLQQY